jgi:predicted RNA binding protein YcfA (HicA-like mRNA interferase family)
MTSKDVIRLLKADGWYEVAREGSHVHPTKRGRVTVPHPKKYIPDGTLGSIRRQSGSDLR